MINQLMDSLHVMSDENFNFPLFWASCDKQASMVLLDHLPNHVQIFHENTNSKLQRVQTQYRSLNYRNVSTQPHNVKLRITLAKK